MCASKQNSIVTEKAQSLVFQKTKKTQLFLGDEVICRKKLPTQQNSLPTPMFLDCSMPSLVFISLRACLFLTDVYSLHWCLFKTLPIYLKSAHTECWCTTLPNWLSWKINSERLFQQQTGWYSYSFPTFIYVPHKQTGTWYYRHKVVAHFSAVFRILGSNLVLASLSPLDQKMAFSSLLS